MLKIYNIVELIKIQIYNRIVCFGTDRCFEKVKGFLIDTFLRKNICYVIDNDRKNK